MKKTLLNSITMTSVLIALSIVAFGQRPTIGGYTVYYGDLHNHSNVSDGTGTPATAYSYAKNTAKLDFFSLADHSGSISSTEWTDIKNQANAINQDGVFTAFYGFEWSSGGQYGHVAVINTDDYCTTTSPTNTFAGLVTWLASRPNGVAFFNHPGREDAAGLEFSHFTTTPSNQFVGMELWNKGDYFVEYYYNDGYYTNDNNKGYFDEAITRGWKIGAAGAGDNHSGTWGTAYPARLAILANNLTRTDLLAAMQARRFFSTLDQNLSLSFKINGQEMGSTMIAGNYSLQIQAADGNNEIFTEVVLFDKNHNIVSTWTPNVTNVNITSTLNTLHGDYFYVKVKQADGQEAITSPIWISGGASNQAPTCSISSPASGTSYSAPATITIQSNATDSDGTIAKVEFYQGSTKLGEDTSSPYSYTWSNVAAGSYSITAKATDNLGAVTTSSTVNVTVTTSGGSTPITVSKRIATGMDDVEESKTGSMYTNSSDIELVYDGTTYGNQVIGLRFTGLNIPQGATISKAYIQFTCDEKKTAATSVTIRGEAADNSAAFTTASKNVSNRTKTTASVAWNNIPAWNTVNAATSNERTPELQTIVQEIVNRTGFTTSSAMTFIITGTGTRTAHAYEGSSAKAPLLYIEYTVGGLKNEVLFGSYSDDNTVIETGQTLTPEQIKVYPNPVTNDIHVNINGINSTISIYDMQGILVLQTTSCKDIETISMSSIPSGMYIVEVSQENVKKTFTILKQ